MKTKTKNDFLLNKKENLSIIIIYNYSIIYKNKNIDKYNIYLKLNFLI